MDANTAVKNKVAFMISMTIIVVAIVFLVIGGYLAFVPVNVVRANVQPYTIDTKVIAAGDNLIYTADVCKYRSITSTAVRQFVDEQDVHYPISAQVSNIPPGCAKHKVVIPTLPTYHPGKWYVTLDIQYQINPLRVQSYHFRTDTFTITKPKLPGVQ